MDFEQQLKEIERLNLSNPYPSLAARLNFQGVHDITGGGGLDTTRSAWALVAQALRCRRCRSA